MRFRHFGCAGPGVDRRSDAVAALGSPRRRRTRRSGPREAPRRSREGGRPVPDSLHRKADGSAARAGPRHRRSRRAHRPRHGGPVRAGTSPLRADAEHQGGRAAQRKDGSSRAAGDKRHLHPRLSCLISCVWATPRVPELGPVIGEPSPVGRLINHLLSQFDYEDATRTRRAVRAAGHAVDDRATLVPWLL